MTVTLIAPAKEGRQRAEKASGAVNNVSERVKMRDSLRTSVMQIRRRLPLIVARQLEIALVEVANPRPVRIQRGHPWRIRATSTRARADAARRRP